MADYTVKIENALGEMLQLYPSGDYILTGITGITPADAVINAVEMANLDGARYNNSRVGTRNIVITLKVRGEGYDVRRRRINLYRYAKTKQKIRVYIAHDQRDVVIDGYLESLQDAETIFSDDQRLMMSIICPNPFFRDNGAGENRVSFSAINGLFAFPFSIAVGEPEPMSTKTLDYLKVVTNSGDVDTGMVLTVKAHGVVANPVFYNETAGQTMTLDISLEDGDELTITTEHGAKSARLTRDGATTNVMNAIGPGSDWLTLQPGDNTFYYSASSGADNMELMFSYTNLFEGM